MKIRREHIDALDKSMEALAKEEILDRLQHEFPYETKAMDDYSLKNLVDDSYADARELEIYETKNIYRLTKLNFLSPRLKKSPFIQSILIRVLNNLELEGSKRLDFIEQNVVHRDFTDAELGGRHST